MSELSRLRSDGVRTSTNNLVGCGMVLWMPYFSLESWVYRVSSRDHPVCITGSEFFWFCHVRLRRTFCPGMAAAGDVADNAHDSTRLVNYFIPFFFYNAPVSRDADGRPGVGLGSVWGELGFGLGSV